MYYVYMLQDVERPETIYLGYTSDLKRRVKEHNAGGNASTRGRRWRVLYYEAYSSEALAREREAKLKRNRKMRQLLTRRIQVRTDGEALSD